jgi:hypothetical protein
LFFIYISDGILLFESGEGRKSYLRFGFVWVASVEVADVLGGIGDVVSGLPGSMFGGVVIARPLDKVFYFISPLVRVEDGRDFILDLIVELNRWRRQLSAIWGGIGDVRFEEANVEDGVNEFH